MCRDSAQEARELLTRAEQTQVLGGRLRKGKEHKDWGGKPFVDMKKGWDYVLERYPEIDQDRAVAAGASWGGYAIKYGYDFPTIIYDPD